MAFTPRVAVIYYSSTGTTYRLARAAVEGAEQAGAEVRLRRVAELAPEAAVRQNPAWLAHLHESTLLALYNVLYHWGCIVVAPGYADRVVFEAGGNPYGVSWTARSGEPQPDERALAAARYLARRVVEVARWIGAGREQRRG